MADFLPDGRGGWLWMDIDTATAANRDVAIWPGDGQGSLSLTASHQGFITYFGFMVLTADNTEADVQLRHYDGTTVWSTQVVQTTAVAGDLYLPLMAGAAVTIDGVVTNSAAATANTAGISMRGFSIFMEDVATPTLKIRVFFRPDSAR